MDISSKLKALRKSKSVTQAELDKMAGLPTSSVSKIENGRREATANELVRLAHSLGVNLNAFSSSENIYVYSDEIRIIEALREIPFEDFQRLIKTLEAQVYFASKDAPSRKKKYLQELVAALSSMSSSDQRPRSQFSERIRVRK